MKYINKLHLIYKLMINILDNYLFSKQVYYVTENADWVITDIGNSLFNNLRNIKFKIIMTPFGIKNSIIHYASINTFFGKDKIKLPHKSNKIIVSWFHVVPNDERIKLLPEAIKYVAVWHTSCQSTKNKMIEFGIPEKRIIVIPLGVELKYFNKSSIEEKSSLLKKFEIPKDKIVIGSFQKDGNGWGKGLEPKLIKGPDIFCDVVELLATQYDIFVLLTGPARGYVKNRLEIANIPYRHDFLEIPNEVADYFKAIDLYMVTSREEGGPKSILESMACGIPLISTKVGMAPDMIIDGENGFLVDIEDTDDIYNKACEIIEDEELQNKFILNGLKTIKNYNWTNISNQYFKKIYQELL